MNVSSISTASSFDQLSLWSARFGALLLDHLDLKPDMRILDVATGTGFPLLELAMLAGQGSYAVGVDLWQEALERGEAKRAAYDQRNAAFTRTDGVALPFAGAVFDLITIHLGINNFANPDAVILECSRVVKRGGRLALTSNVKGHYREFYDVFRRMVEALNDPEALARLDANENHRGTRDGWTQVIEAQGFEVVKRADEQFTMRFVDGTALLNHLLVRMGFLPAWRKVVGEAAWDAFLPALETRLNALAGKHGELKMSVPMIYVEARRVQA